MTRRPEGTQEGRDRGREEAARGRVHSHERGALLDRIYLYFTEVHK